MSTITLLIPTLESRKIQFGRLLDCLAPQLNGRICMNITRNNGNKSIGELRNDLLKTVKTDYCVFIDDDDIVAEDYIDTHLYYIDTYKPDAIGFKGQITFDGKRPTEFEHRHGNPIENYRMQYIRPINHLNVIKTEIAQAIGYQPITFGEDMDYAERLADSGMIQNSQFIDKIMYYYLYNSTK